MLYVEEYFEIKVHLDTYKISSRALDLNPICIGSILCSFTGSSSL